MSCAPATATDLDHRTDDIAAKVADALASSGDNVTRWSSSDSVMTAMCNSDRQLVMHYF
jgi:hypothetical protein